MKTIFSGYVSGYDITYRYSTSSLDTYQIRETTTELMLNWYSEKKLICNLDLGVKDCEWFVGLGQMLHVFGKVWPSGVDGGGTCLEAVVNTCR